TQLTRRLEKEGRLLKDVWVAEADQCTGGLNFVTRRPRRDVLADYRTVLQRVYAPPAFFERVRRVGRALKRPNHGTGPASLKGRLGDFKALGRVMWRMTVRRPDLRRHFWSTFIDCARHNPAALEYVVMMMVVYLHLGTFAQYVIHELDRKIAAEQPDSPKAAAGGILQIA